jgi:hypothetical protein
MHAGNKNDNSTVAAEMKKGIIPPPDIVDCATIMAISFMHTQVNAETVGEVTRAADLINDMNILIAKTIGHLNIFKKTDRTGVIILVAGMHDIIPKKNVLDNEDHSVTIAKAALDLMASKFEFEWTKDNPLMRVMIETGPLTGSVIKGRLPTYELFGTTVTRLRENISSTPKNAVIISDATRIRLVESDQCDAFHINENSTSINSLNYHQLRDPEDLKPKITESTLTRVKHKVTLL